MPTNAVQEAPEVIEGTWEEISRLAGKLNGHRLRVTILPDEELAVGIPNFPSTGRYAARVQSIFAQDTVPATAEEVSVAEREMQERMQSMNQNRRRDGAEPLF